MKSPSRILHLSLLFLATLILPLAGQDAEKPQPVTIADPEIAVDHLDLLLDPLTQAELGVEAEGWRDLVKASVQALSEAGIASRKVSEEKADGQLEGGEADAEKSRIVDDLAKLQERKTDLLTRLDTVLKEYEDKGGDASEYRTYATAVSGVKLDVKDGQATVSAIRGWLTSKEGGIKWAIGTLKFLGIMITFWLLSGIISGIVRKVVERHEGLSDLLKRFINKLIRRAILFIGLLVALSTVGVNVGALVALIGGSAFIVAFALQDTLGNFAAGLMLLLYRPFDVGDVVEVAGVTGKVDNVSLVSTKIMTFDNKVVLVPNKNVWGQVITNATASAERRVDMVFGIGYDDDIGKAQGILEKIVAGQDKVLKNPEPVIQMNELADSSVNFICRPWTKTEDYWAVYWDITRKVKDEFDAAGISIPYPQQDVHLHQVGANPA